MERSEANDGRNRVAGASRFFVVENHGRYRGLLQPLSWPSWPLFDVNGQTPVLPQFLDRSVHSEGGSKVILNLPPFSLI